MKKILLVILILGCTNSYGSEIKCLADNVYFEARSQGQAGWVAVTQVTLNRVQDKRFPNTICEVVKQGLTYESGHPIKNKCQFSWYCDGKSDKIKNFKIYDEIIELVNYIIDQNLFDITDGATHYHADYVRPSWAKTKTKTIEIDDHIFYRWER
jgi:spore germination cell wall hydrolase CwlJ-like protein